MGMANNSLDAREELGPLCSQCLAGFIWTVTVCLTQKYRDAISTHQTETSQWNKTRDLCVSQFDLQLVMRKNLISNLMWNMSVLHQTVPNVRLNSRFNEAID